MSFAFTASKVSCDIHEHCYKLYNHVSSVILLYYTRAKIHQVNIEKTYLKKTSGNVDDRRLETLILCHNIYSYSAVLSVKAYMCTTMTYNPVSSLSYTLVCQTCQTRWAKHPPSSGLMLGHCFQRWPNIESTAEKYLVFFNKPRNWGETISLCSLLDVAMVTVIGCYWTESLQ